jgi:pimeloyl-ACP methyl ester carboxylesterase
MAEIGTVRPDSPMRSTEETLACIAYVDRLCERHTVEYTGRRVVWHRFGNGPPLVLIHGGHGSWLHWIRNVEVLGSRFSVWIPDLPGYGDSDTAASAELASILEPTIATLNLLIGASARIHLVGFSFGGLVAAHFAARRQNIDRLVLLGPAGHGGVRRPKGKLASWREAAESQDKEALQGIMRHNLAMHMLHDPGHIDALAVTIHADACMRTRFRSKNLSRNGGLGAVLEHHCTELLLIWGEHDVTADPEAVIPLLTEGRSGRDAHIIPGAGHWVQYERADEVNRLLLDWPGLNP